VDFHPEFTVSSFLFKQNLFNVDRSKLFVELVNLSDAVSGRTPLRQIANPLRAGQWRLVSDITATQKNSGELSVIFKTAGSFSKENFLGTLYSPLLP
jgi:hypothetical protein